MNMQQKLIAFNTLAGKEIWRFFTIWPQTLLPPAITTFLYFLVFGSVIGTHIGAMNGVPYSVFITPGLIMLSLINSAYSNVMGSFYGARFGRHIEEILVSPMPNNVIIAAYMAGGTLRGVIISIIVFAISLIFTGWHGLPHPFLALAVVLLTSLLFSLFGLLNGIFAKSFDDLMIATSFVLTPLIYLGGVFYNIESLPPFWRMLSSANPIHYIVQLFRYALINISFSGSVALSLFIIVVFCAATFGVVLVMLNKGIRLKS